MDKMKMSSENLVERNIDKIAELFPNCITETVENGEGKRKVDFDLLRQELSNVLVEGKDERYRLDWSGKRQAILTANSPIAKTLRPVREDETIPTGTDSNGEPYVSSGSVGKDGTKGGFDSENLYIEGDNLDVLKLLHQTYLNKVKMIYIDPPYNTGNDFVYNDDFAEDSEEYLRSSNQKDEQGARLTTNKDTSGRYHSKWLSMMYMRLKIARDLLTDDGVIFISIDDNEQANLKKICDEVFGGNNFIATIIRNTNSSKNQSLFISVSHEYCLVYSKEKIILEKKHFNDKWSVPKNNFYEYIKKINELQKIGLSHDEITEELKILTKYPRFIDFTNYWYFDNRGLYRKDNLGGVKNGNNTKIVNKLTNELDPLPPGGYRYSDKKMQELINDDRIHFHIDGSLATLKRYLHENEEQRPKSIMSDDQRPDYSLLRNFNTPFDNPKQLNFMERILYIGDKNSLILDFFSGSATTAHAVMQLNAEDGGSRKFIMVQLPEVTDEKSEAHKAGYSNICEIGKERIRRAGRKVLADISKDSLSFKKNKMKYTEHEVDGIQQALLIDKEILNTNTEKMLKIKELVNSKLEEYKKGMMSKEDVANFYNEINSLNAQSAVVDFLAKKLNFDSSELIQKSTELKSLANQIIKIAKEEVASPDIGFRVLKLDDSNMKEVYYNPSEYLEQGQSLLFKLEKSIKEDRTAEDVLFQIMLDKGVLLSSQIELRQAASGNQSYYVVGKTDYDIIDLICCLDDNIDTEAVKEIAKLNPECCVFLDSSMKDDSTRTNIEQMFDTYSPNTNVEVI